MTWLVYHEFGRDHRSFEWGAAISTKYVPTELEYWLAQWVGVCRFLMEQVSEDDKHWVFVCYERLCEQSSEVWSDICKLLDIPPRTELTNGFAVRNRNGTTQATEAGSLLSEAYSIYRNAADPVIESNIILMSAGSCKGTVAPGFRTSDRDSPQARSAVEVFEAVLRRCAAEYGGVTRRDALDGGGDLGAPVFEMA